MISIMLFKYLKNKATFKWHLSNLVVFLRINLFTKINLWVWIDNPLLVEQNHHLHSQAYFLKVGLIDNDIDNGSELKYNNPLKISELQYFKVDPQGLQPSPIMN